uniref:Type I restriction-modification system, specificity subunit S n=1 Tax=uncultured bacterium A1Q1_fos_1880 TaxID=1256556 RepID=L7VWR8_9BACT|nr:type I restriction-modification system, specificity subunit S [uncultured bacterium A1Q1_fos_1880]
MAACALPNQRKWRQWSCRQTIESCSIVYYVLRKASNEQKRIVAKVDEPLARCAALERKLGQAQVAGRQLTAAVLQGVVE